jgi:hypothetical protein
VNIIIIMNIIMNMNVASSRLSLFLLLAAGSIFLSSDAFCISGPTCRLTTFRPSLSSSSSLSSTSSAEEALQRTAAQLDKLKQKTSTSGRVVGEGNDAYEALYRDYVQLPANSLKGELKRRKLPQKGRKPDLAQRLAEYDYQQQTGGSDTNNNNNNGGVEEGMIEPWNIKDDNDDAHDDNNDDADDHDDTNNNGVAAVVQKSLRSFCGIQLSSAAGAALGRAKFDRPSPIQAAAIPLQCQGSSLILHAQTGSGKTLAYLLPITEQLWLEKDSDDDDGDNQGYGVILTPTRELAAQVAGIATVLAPPGTVRMVSHATNLMSNGLKEKGEEEHGGRLDTSTTSNTSMGAGGRTRTPRLYIGSAKAVMHSLYGDGKMPASPTTKPEAMNFIRNVRWLVLDEVDRLLEVKKGYVAKKKQHEKPAAVVAAAVARLTSGRAQVISASATVGRPFKRELTRVLGLSPQDCPLVVRGKDDVKDDDDDDMSDDDGDHDDNEEEAQVQSQPGVHVGRAVTIPDTVTNYVTPVDTSSVGKLLTSAMLVIKALLPNSASSTNKNNNKKERRILLVLTRGCGLNTKNAIGALKHFGCKPEPQSLLDALEADGTDNMMEKHRQVSGATGIGESYFREQPLVDDDNDTQTPGYVLVTGEDTIRGLHLDGLDVVIVVGRAHGPDEYTHIAGRTGRAGRPGKVINVLSLEQAKAVNAWEKMLNVEFQRLELDDIADLD